MRRGSLDSHSPLGGVTGLRETMGTVIQWFSAWDVIIPEQGVWKRFDYKGDLGSGVCLLTFAAWGPGILEILKCLRQPHTCPTTDGTDDR